RPGGGFQGAESCPLQGTRQRVPRPIVVVDAEDQRRQLSHGLLPPPIRRRARPAPPRRGASAAPPPRGRLLRSTGVPRRDRARVTHAPAPANRGCRDPPGAGRAPRPRSP